MMKHFTVKASEEAKKHKKLCASKTKRSSCSGADCIESYTMEDKRNAGHPYLYFTKHGVGPGTLPKDVNVMKWEDLDNYMTAIWVDRPLSTEELNQYDIYPETRNGELRKQYGISTSKVTCDDEPNYTEDDDIVIYVDGKQEYIGNIYDTGCRETFERICERQDVYDMLFRFCNSFGDDLVEKGDSPKEVGDATWILVRFNFEDNTYGLDDFYEDFDSDYHYNDPNIEIFLASEMA